MATKDEFIQLIAEELGVDTNDVGITVTGSKLVITVSNVDEEDVFDEDFDIGEEGDEEGAAPVAGK